MENNHIIDSDGCIRNIVVHNGITFLSETRDQAFFDRKRSTRLRNQFKINENLILLIQYSFTINEKDIIDKYGKESANDTFLIIDKIIDLSYYDEECNHPRKEFYYGAGGESIDKERNHKFSGCWLIHSPSKEAFEENLSLLKEKLQEIIPHEENEQVDIEDEYPCYYGD